jgi:hypothetical protein
MRLASPSSTSMSLQPARVLSQRDAEHLPGGLHLAVRITGVEQAEQLRAALLGQTLVGPG